MAAFIRLASTPVYSAFHIVNATFYIPIYDLCFVIDPLIQWNVRLCPQYLLLTCRRSFESWRVAFPSWTCAFPSQRCPHSPQTYVFPFCERGDWCLLKWTTVELPKAHRQYPFVDILFWSIIGICSWVFSLKHYLHRFRFLLQHLFVGVLLLQFNLASDYRIKSQELRALI